MEFINLTPHAISVLDAEGGTHTFPPSGTVARVVESIEDTTEIGGFRFATKAKAEVVGLPDWADVPTRFYIVSGMVLDAAKGLGRNDLCAPDTGADAMRNSQGHIVAVRGFVW